LPSQTRLSLSTLTSLLIDDPSNQAFTAAQVLAKLEEAQERFVLDTRALRDLATGSAVAQQQEYSLPSDIMDIVRLSVDGAELTRISKADLAFLFRGSRWDQTYGTPSHYYVDLDPNNKKYGLYPIPTSAGSSNITIEYVKMPPTLSGDSSVPLDAHTLLIPYHNSLAYWAAKELLMIRPSQENLVRVQQYTKRYEDEVSNCIETFKHLEQSQGWRFKGGRYHKGL
jgi:hypothetical protein